MAATNYRACEVPQAGFFKKNRIHWNLWKIRNLKSLSRCCVWGTVYIAALLCSLIPQAYEATLLKLKMKIQQAKDVCLTADESTSINNEGFMAITVHFFDEDCKMNFRTSNLKTSIWQKMQIV